MYKLSYVRSFSQCENDVKFLFPRKWGRILSWGKWEPKQKTFFFSSIPNETNESNLFLWVGSIWVCSWNVVRKMVVQAYSRHARIFNRNRRFYSLTDFFLTWLQFDYICLSFVRSSYAILKRGRLKCIDTVPITMIQYTTFEISWLYYHSYFDSEFVFSVQIYVVGSEHWMIFLFVLQYVDNEKWRVI